MQERETKGKKGSRIVNEEIRKKRNRRKEKRKENI